ncbi:BatD family protein [Desulfofustis glycolicus]|uniref:Oxygen tolerance n=1 Tax=Desulfofustis glycolicus DSM 9705 TaxID=1121409 RepID=A0A1M5WJ62_9BACT|nr:BatD family protein [Desulfofustis glycolicus]MCB2216816.1 BatD family protein [Desulfobulbaceae bacterium]SHH87491.1 Oxygen tolerance [Desulfofustis glycolicus DSM 9705]
MTDIRFSHTTTAHHDRTAHHRLLPAVLLVAALLLTALPANAAVQVSARLTPQNFSTDDAATLQIRIEGQQSAEITLPEIDGLSFHHRGQSRQFQMVNGAITSSLTETYLVTGSRPGTYTIGPVTVTVDGVVHRTEPLTCTVTGASTSPPGSSDPGTDDAVDQPRAAFIKLIPKKQQAYLNEVVPVTITAYFRQGVKVNLSGPPAVRADGILLDIPDREPQQHRELVDGTQYTAVTWNGTLTGIKEGRQEISAEADATLLVPVKRRQRLPGFGTDLFDDSLLDDLLGGYKNRPLTLTAPALSFTVVPLPAENRPQGFAGAVGSFTLDLQASPDHIEIGDPLTLTMTVAGTGNFDTVTAPRLSSSEGLKEYPPTATLQSGQTPYLGKKIFEQAVVVTDPAVRRLPPLAFSFFDPQRRSYQTLLTDPVDLVVTNPAGAGTSPTTGTRPGAQLPAPVAQEKKSTLDDLAPAKLTRSPPGSFVPLFRQPWFVNALVAVLAAIAGVSALRLHRTLQERRPERQYARAKERLRRETLALIDQTGTVPGGDYLPRARQAVRSFLALCWQTRADALTTADIRSRLGDESPVSTLFLMADRHAYGAAQLTEEQRRDLHEALRTLIREWS